MENVAAISEPKRILRKETCTEHYLLESLANRELEVLDFIFVEV